MSKQKLATKRPHRASSRAEKKRRREEERAREREREREREVENKKKKEDMHGKHLTPVESPLTPSTPEP